MILGFKFISVHKGILVKHKVVLDLINYLFELNYTLDKTYNES